MGDQKKAREARKEQAEKLEALTALLLNSHRSIEDAFQTAQQIIDRVSVWVESGR